MKDVVIVGGGLAGLAAGWRLRHWDTVLLESGSRVGGRIHSERRGRYWLNWADPDVAVRIPMSMSMSQWSRRTKHNVGR